MSRPVILVVDDDAPVLAVIAEMLEARLGAEVLRAASAEEGLQLLRANRVDAIVSDFRMPSMQGTEFLRRCAAIAPHAARVLMTGYGDVSLVRSALNDARVNKMILKPLDGDDLVRCVSDAIDRAALDLHRQRAFDRASRAFDAPDDDARRL